MNATTGIEELDINMKKAILLISIIIFPFQRVFTQNIYKGEIVYTIKFNIKKKESYKNSEGRKNMKKKMRVFFDKMYLNATEEKGILLFNTQESVFQLTSKMKNDYTKGINYVKEKAGGNRVFYYNSFLKQNVEQDCDLLDKCFLINATFYEWEITQDSKIIAGFQCYRAVITKVYKSKKSYSYAWFAPQIPVNFGPGKYNGLPGLILELEENSIIYTATKIELNGKKKLKIKKPKGKKITQKEFRSLFWRSMNVKF